MANALVQAIHNEYQFSIKQIEAVLKLLEDKNTVPFIARYRKEMTDGLDEVEIKKIADEFNYMQNLQKRKDEVIHNIEQQGLLTEALKQDILKQTKLQRVEDLYRPYKQKKKTRATEAKRKGLAPLAKWIDAQNETESIDIRAKQFINEEVPTIEAAILGAQDIIAERIADHPQYRQRILNETQRHGVITATKKKNAVDENETFAMYYDYSEP
ncbi:RNA-binding transcriptional accessory protein, partial [Staphylococcus agnetis]